jgi:hypothetical protein
MGGDEMKKLISFKKFKEVCAWECFRGKSVSSCMHPDGVSLSDCCEKGCPVWSKLEKVKK